MTQTKVAPVTDSKASEGFDLEAQIEIPLTEIYWTQSDHIVIRQNDRDMGDAAILLDRARAKTLAEGILRMLAEVR